MPEQEALTPEQEAFKQCAEHHRIKLLEHWPEMAMPEVAEQFVKDAAAILGRYNLHPACLWDYRVVLMVRDLIDCQRERKEAA